MERYLRVNESEKRRRLSRCWREAIRVKEPVIQMRVWEEGVRGGEVGI